MSSVFNVPVMPSQTLFFPPIWLFNICNSFFFPSVPFLLQILCHSPSARPAFPPGCFSFLLMCSSLKCSVVYTCSFFLSVPSPGALGRASLSSAIFLLLSLFRLIASMLFSAPNTHVPLLLSFIISAYWGTIARSKGKTELSTGPSGCSMSCRTIMLRLKETSSSAPCGRMPTALRKSSWIQFAISVSENKTNRQTKKKKKKSWRLWRLQAMQGHRHANGMNFEQCESSDLKLLPVKWILKR